MDYRALAEFVWFTLLGLTALLIGGSIAFRVVFKPFLQDFLDAYRDRGRLSAGTSDERIGRLEGRILEMEDELETLRAGRRFDAELMGPATPEADPSA